MEKRITTPRNGEIKSLTSLRGVAAFAVVLQHFSTTAQEYATGSIPSLVPHGYMAVDFFFVLSGFIMAYTYSLDFQANGMRAFAPFLLKRVARIAPLGLAATAAILVLGGIAAHWGRSDLFITDNAKKSGLVLCTLVNIAHLQGFLPLFNLNPPSWSVSFEIAAYLLFPIYIYVLSSGGIAR